MGNRGGRTLFCKNCGAELANNQKYCHGCGIATYSEEEISIDEEIEEENREIAMIDEEITMTKGESRIAEENNQFAWNQNVSESSENAWFRKMEYVDASKEINLTRIIVFFAIMVVAGIVLISKGKNLAAQTAANHAPSTASYDSDVSSGDDNKKEILKKDKKIKRKESGETDGFSWEAFEDGIKIISYTTESENGMNVRIPSDIDGYPILCIGEKAFAELPIETVEISNSVNTIEYAAFAGCESLQSVIFGGAVGTIGKQAFSKCTSLEMVQLNEGLNKIGEEAFKNCKNLKEIIIPSTVTDIGGASFSYTNLCSITIEEGTEDASIGYGAFGFIKNEDFKELQIPGNYIEIGEFIVPDTVSKIVLGRNAEGKDQTIKGRIINSNQNEMELHFTDTFTGIPNSLHDEMWGKKVTIYGPTGSKIEQYALEKGIDFIVE